jgi:hypothetical protein
MLCNRSRASLDERHYRVVELLFQLAILNALGQMTQPGSPEQGAAIAELEPLLGAVLALIEELEVDPFTPVIV